TGKRVCSMAYGGYGPTHSLILWDEAVAFSPKIIIEAFYAGNDLYDSFHHVYNQRQLPELKSADPQLQARVRQAEQSEPITKRVSGLFQQVRVNPVAVQQKTTAVTRNSFSLRRLLSQHSRLYGLLRRARYESARLMSNPNNTLEQRWEEA